MEESVFLGKKAPIFFPPKREKPAQAMPGGFFKSLFRGSVMLRQT